MSSFKKSIKKLVNNPQSVRFDELQNILLRIGCELRKRKRKGGSHCVFKREEDGAMISVPKERIVKKEYIKQAIDIFKLDEMIDD